MRCFHGSLALLAALLVACGARNSSEVGGAVADVKSRSALASLPASVVGDLDMSSGESGNLEDGTVMLYGSLRVGEEDFSIQANADMLESSGITQESSKVRASISAKTSPHEGGIRYTIISVDKF